MLEPTLGSRANRWLPALSATDHPARGTDEPTKPDDGVDASPSREV